MSLLRRAYDHRRDLWTWLPAAALAHPSNRARQLVTNTLLSPSPVTAPLRRRHLTGDANARSTAILNAAFHRQSADHSLRHHRFGCTAALKTTVATLAQPPFPFQSDKSNQTPALNLHRLAPPPVRTPPAVSSLEAFRTPASVHPTRLCLAGIRKPLTRVAIGTGYQVYDFHH